MFLVTSCIGVARRVMSHLWQLQLYWGFIVGLGTGGIATVMGATVANAWFEPARARDGGYWGPPVRAANLPALAGLGDRRVGLALRCWPYGVSLARCPLAPGLDLYAQPSQRLGLQPYGAAPLPDRLLDAA
jgi:hypothetical protein